MTYALSQLLADEDTTGRVRDFLLVLMACGQDVVLVCPRADGAHETACIQFRPHGEEHVASGCGGGADVVPEGGVERLGRETILCLELCVEVACPHAALCTIHRGLVEEGRYHGLPEGIGEMLVVCPVRVLNEEADGLGGEVVHVRVSVRHTLEEHHLPAAFGSRPCELVRLVEMLAQVDYFIRRPVPRHQAHYLSLHREFA